MPEHIPAEGEVTVVVARTMALALAADLDHPFLAVYPDFDNWNDYGRQYFARLVAVGADGDRMEAQFRLMVDGYMTTATALIDALGEKDVVSIESLQPNFVSLLPDTNQYGELVRTLGFGTAVSALRLLGDAVVLNIEENDDDLLELIRSENFHLGVLRHSGSYAALRRGARYFRETPPAEVEDAARSFTFSTMLPNADNAYSITFDFEEDPIFQDRAAVLIGKNGTGKTQTLKSIIAELTNLPEAQTGEGEVAFNPPINVSRVLVFSSVPDDPFPRRIGAWNGIDYEHFPISAHDPSRPDGTLAALASCLRGDRGVHFGEDGDIGRMDLIKFALEPLGLWRRLHVPLTPKENDDFPHVVNVEGQSFVSAHFPAR